jgi:uncharacterized protein (TIGR02246 family)
MSKLLTGILVAIFTCAGASLLLPAGSLAAENPPAAADQKAVEKAVDQWFVVLNAMLNGDPAPFADLYSHTDDATYMGAEGTYRIGWTAIYGDWKAQAEKSTGGKVEGVEIRVVVGVDMATATHVTKGSIKQPDGKMIDIAARETSVFRKEGGEWRMIAHHADGLAYWEQAFK